MNPLLTSAPGAQRRPEALNWPHLLMLLALPPYAWLCARWAWPAELSLALGTLLGLGWLMAWERLRPGRADWQASAADMRRDASSLGLASLTDLAFSLLITTSALIVQQQELSWRGAQGAALRSFWQALPWPVALLLVIALGEFLPYWLHRWAHAWPSLWRWHAVHHWPTAVNASNSVLVHPFNVLWNKLGRLLPAVFLAVPAELMLWAALFIQMQELAAHANVAGSLRGLRGLLGGAELHRWHHSVVLDEAGNFGTVLPWWDWVFGSLVWPQAAGPAAVGWAEGAPRPSRLGWSALILGAVPRPAQPAAAEDQDD